MSLINYGFGLVHFLYFILLQYSYYYCYYYYSKYFHYYNYNYLFIIIIYSMMFFQYFSSWIPVLWYQTYKLHLDKDGLWALSLAFISFPFKNKLAWLKWVLTMLVWWSRKPRKITENKGTLPVLGFCL